MTAINFIAPDNQAQD